MEETWEINTKMNWTENYKTKYSLKLSKAKRRLNYSKITPKRNKTKLIKYSTATTISTTGYCHDIFFWQNLHLPPKNKKLITGIRSKFFICFLHLGQYDLRPAIDSWWCSRHIRALSKLPIQRPKRKTNKYNANIIILSR